MGPKYDYTEHNFNEFVGFLHAKIDENVLVELLMTVSLINLKEIG